MCGSAIRSHVGKLILSSLSSSSSFVHVLFWFVVVCFIRICPDFLVRAILYTCTYHVLANLKDEATVGQDRGETKTLHIKHGMTIRKRLR